MDYVRRAQRVNKFNNYRYNVFITLFYFTISPFIDNLNEENIKDLKILNELIIKLSKDVNDKNYNDIIIFFQKNNYDVNNKLIDQIVREQDENLKSILKSKLQNVTGIDFTSTGYAVQLFSILIKEQQPFIFVNNTNIKEKNVSNNLHLNLKKNIHMTVNVDEIKKKMCCAQK